MKKTDPQDCSVSAVKDAIRNPADPNHFMVLKPINAQIAIHIGDTLVAETDSAVRLIEIGNIAYPPRVYLPLADVTAQLEAVDKQTHCPLKGDAFYLALDGAEIGWSYKALDFAAQLQGLVSFNAPGLRIEETY